MKIQFINATLGGDFSALDIAITALATYINERTPHSATIVDMTFHRKGWKKHLAKNLERDNPQVVGISLNTLFMQHVKNILAELKRTRPEIKTILGGYHPSIHPEDTLDMENVDAICIGDGEYVVEEYLNRIEHNENLEGVKGLWAKVNGSKIKNERGSFIEDTDSLPIPNYDLWEDLDKYFYFLGMLYIIGSRGCPYRCTYCDAHEISQAVDGKYFRVKDPIKYANEIAHQWRKYKDRNLRLAQLFDQVFTMDKKWVKSFCDEYRNLELHKQFRFSTFSRIDHIDKERAEILGKSGCALLRVGVEAGDPYIRNEIYKKKISNEKIKEIFDVCHENGIKFTAFYMLGGPAETHQTCKKTIDMAVQLNAARSAFFIYKPFTQEGMAQIVEHGGFVDQERWNKADNITFDAVVKLKDMTPKQVEQLQRKAYFFTFGRRLLRMIRRQKLRYFIQLITYMTRGIRNGLSPAYLAIYYHIYGYDNVDN